MIERIYIDNVRSFVNFEWRPGPLAVLLGDNGSGKTGLLEAFEALYGFLMSHARSTDIFPASTRTRWETRREQTLELDVRQSRGLYRYRLVLEHDEHDPRQNRVASETLALDGKPLLSYSGSEIQLAKDDETAATFPWDGSRSAVGAVGATDETQRIAGFLVEFIRFYVLRPDPRAMRAEIDRNNSLSLAKDLSNFSSWYVEHLPKMPSTILRAMPQLAEVLPGFLDLLSEEGVLVARFGEEAGPTRYRFDELSDGQRALIALYVLREVTIGHQKTLLIDEPDNYVALREIQPWLNSVTDTTLKKTGGQVMLISHHPEVLNLLASDFGWRFFREPNGPTRVERFKPVEGLDAAETVARGWEDG